MHHTPAPTRPNARQGALLRLSGMSPRSRRRPADHAANSILFPSKSGLFGLLPTKFPEYPQVGDVRAQIEFLLSTLRSGSSDLAWFTTEPVFVGESTKASGIRDAFASEAVYAA